MPTYAGAATPGARASLTSGVAMSSPSARRRRRQASGGSAPSACPRSCGRPSASACPAATWTSASPTCWPSPGGTRPGRTPRS
eukprot:6275181-Alexandrium_andersonii.AAC.2